MKLSRELLGRWTGLLLFAFFAGRQLLPATWGGTLPLGADLLTQLRWLLITGLFGLFLHAYIIRKPALALANRPMEILLPLICAPMPLAVILLNQHYFQQLDFRLWIHQLTNSQAWFALWNPSTSQITTGLVIMALGEGLTVAGMWHLRASFSILTEARGLILSGPYQWIRHPLYAGEILSAWGYAIAVPNRLTMTGALLFTLLQTGRALVEEAKLLQHYPDYRNHQRNTGFLLPKRFKPASRCLAAILVLLAANTACAAEDNPLAYRPLPTPQTDSFPEPGRVTQWFLFPLSLYSNTISSVDSDRCPSFPSCSQYAQEALRRHGVIPGIWLAVDRLIHERTEIQRPDRIRLSDGSLHVPDTLNANDFWFHQPNQEKP